MAEPTEEPSVEIAAPVAEAGVSAEPADPALEAAEREASDAGWVPKERWKGPPERWRPAKDFLDARDHVLPILQRENKALRAKLEEQGGRLAALEKEHISNEAKRSAIQQETLQYERQQALESGDYAKVNKLDAAILDAKIAAKTNGTAQQPQPLIDPEVARTWNEFSAENPWTQKPKMQRVLFAQLKTMRESGTEIAGREMLEEAKEHIARLYPEEFAAPKRTSAMADTGGSNGNSRGGTRTWSDLKPEVREALETMVDGKITKEALLKRCAENPTQYFRR